MKISNFSFNCFLGVHLTVIKLKKIKKIHLWIYNEPEFGQNNTYPISGQLPNKFKARVSGANVVLDGPGKINGNVNFPSPDTPFTPSILTYNNQVRNLVEISAKFPKFYCDTAMPQIYIFVTVKCKEKHLDTILLKLYQNVSFLCLSFAADS